MQLSFLLKTGGVDCMSWPGADNESVDEDGLFRVSICSVMIRGRELVLQVTCRCFDECQVYLIVTLMISLSFCSQSYQA